jgi:hypothetical protein
MKKSQPYISAVDQIFCIFQIMEKMEIQWDHTFGYKLISRKSAIRLGGKFCTVYVFIAFGLLITLVGLINMCLNETCIELGIDERL